MRSKKWMSMIVAGVLLAMCLTGCGADGVNQGSSKTEESVSTSTPQSTSSPDNS